jgi:hypothetical protein
MVDVLFSPRWFFGIDAIFESIAIIATILLSLACFRLYKFTRKVTHKYFSLSFLFLTIAFLAKVITNVLLYFPALREKMVGFILDRYYLLNQTNFVFAIGTTAFRFLMLLGLLGIFWILGKSREKNKLLILLYFIAVVSCVSIFSIVVLGFIIPLYPLFHLTAALLLAYITYFYYSNYLAKKKKATLYIFLSFLFLFSSQLIFNLVMVNLTIYVIAELLQLSGYFLLFYEYYLLVRKG